MAEGSEAQLRGKVKQGLEVRVEVEAFDDRVREALRNVPGVLEIKENQRHGLFLDIQCASDIRADLAKAVVQSGGRLLGLGRKEAELETLFLKLIKTDGAS